MGIYHGHAPLAYSMDMQNGHAWWTNIMDKHHGHAAWICSMYIQRQAVWTSSMNMDMTCEVKTWTCSTAMDMQLGHWNVAQTWTTASRWTCSINRDMQHRHEHAAWTRTCSMDTDMSHGHRHKACTGTYRRDIDIDIDIVKRTPRLSLETGALVKKYVDLVT